MKEIDLKGTQITILSIQVFNGCSKLEKVLLPNNLSEIKSTAFGDCSSLKEIDFPASLTIIGPFSFNKCGF